MRAWSYGRPSRFIAVRMKLHVPLTIAAIDSTWFAARPTPSAWTIGIPPPTAPSKAMARPYLRASANSSAPRSARSALFAVTTSLPLARARQVQSNAWSTPPMTSMTTLTSGSSRTIRGSATIRSRGIGVWRTRRRSRITTHFRSTVRPTRRAIRSPRSISSRATPEPTVPSPSKPTATRSIPTSSTHRWFKERRTAQPKPGRSRPTPVYPRCLPQPRW